MSLKTNEFNCQDNTQPESCVLLKFIIYVNSIRKCLPLTKLCLSTDSISAKIFLKIQRDQNVRALTFLRKEKKWVWKKGRGDPAQSGVAYGF